MAATSVASKQRLLTTLDLLPENAIKEVLTFVEYLLYRQDRSAKATPFKPIALGGLWKNVSITDEDIAEVRQEMWNEPRLAYFEKEDILHLVIAREAESNSVELSPNVTAELRNEG